MISTTKYEENGFADIITGLVKVYNPKVCVELGTQQGASAIIIGKALQDGKLWTYDTFAEKYCAPPYANTQASFERARDNIKDTGLSAIVRVVKANALTVYKEYDKVDLLHIDLCNWFNPTSVLLHQWATKVNQLILIEGGGWNFWQKANGFRPFTPLLDEEFLTNLYESMIIKKNEDYALTILKRREL